MYKKYIFHLFFLSIAVSQSLPELTPSQIKKLKDRGISLDQINLLSNQGVGSALEGLVRENDLEINNLENGDLFNEDKMMRDDINNTLGLDKTNPNFNVFNVMQNPDSISKDLSLNDSLYTDETNQKLRKIRSEIIDEKIRLMNSKKPYFGYDIFQGDPEVFQSSVLESIDPDYLIGPGDEIIIMIWGDTEINKKYTVSRDGYLFIQNVGQVFVNSLTLSKLETKLFRLLKKVYSSLEMKGGQATTFLDVSLGALTYRPHRVFVLGEVDQPGAYNVKPSTSLFSSLYYFNGPKISGSLRSVTLIRNKEQIADIDLYDYLLSGLKINDLRLQRNDIIFIPNRGKTVRVKGEINRTKYFELKPNETLRDLIKIAGGLKSTTYLKRAQIQRIIPYNELVDINVNRTIVDVKLIDVLNGNVKIDLYDGDEITFYAINDIKQNQVEIEGAVNRPGVYDISNDVLLLDLIQKADSLVDNAYLDRAEIIRSKRDGSKIQIDVNLGLVLENDLNNNIKLKTDDLIKIYSNDEMKFKTGVSITGHVLDDGPKEYFEGMNVYDLVFSGGGFENELHLSKTFLDRADLYRKDANNNVIQVVGFNLDSVLAGMGIYDVPINMGDEIRIYSKQEVLGDTKNEVEIIGHVKRPGIYSVGKDGRLKDLLFRAGGFEDAKHLKNTYLDRIDIVRTSYKKNIKNILSFNLRDIIAGDSGINPLLEADDLVRVYSMESFNTYKYVNISGVIKNSGQYELKNNMTLKDLIIEAGGLTDNVFRYRADIARINPQNDNEREFAEILTVSLNNDFNTYSSQETKSNIKLNPFDEVTIRPDPFFKKQIKVSILGYVYYPGDYVLLNPEEKVSDLLKRAGGMRPEAFPFGSEFIRDGKKINISFDKIVRSPRSTENISLIAKDSIIIHGKPNIVEVSGQVNNPGLYQFKKGKSIDDYIEIAGGYAENANKKAYVIYANGQSKKNKMLFSPKVYDGSEIVVPEKSNPEEFNLTTFATNLTSIYADISQILLLASLVRSQ